MAWNGMRQQLGGLKAYMLVAPSMAYLITFLVIPMVVLVLYSLTRPDPSGRLSQSFTLSNYELTILGVGELGEIYSAVVRAVLPRTLYVAAVSTLLCLMLAYPVAYHLGFYTGRFKTTLLMLVIIPFWTSFLIRTFTQKLIFDPAGFLNQGLGLFGISPINIQFTWYTVAYTMVYNYLPLMILPIYASVEKFDFSMLEASYSLGAGRARTFLRITLPLTLPGIAAGSVLVFILTFGEFVIPSLMGSGESGFLVGQLVEARFLGTITRNYSLGAAMSLVSVSVALVLTLVYVKFLHKRGGLEF